MIDLSTCGRLSWRILHSGDANEENQHKMQRASAFHSFLQFFLIERFDAKARTEDSADYNSTLS
jgi:hypothetical protein